MWRHITELLRFLSFLRFLKDNIYKGIIVALKVAITEKIQVITHGEYACIINNFACNI